MGGPRSWDGAAAECALLGARLAAVHFAHQEAQLLRLGGGARATQRVGPRRVLNP